MDAALPDALTRLRDDLEAVRLLLELDGASEARRARDDTVAQVDDYLLPRLRQMDAPLLMVVGGSTGAGKSTILNSLVGTEVSPAGVLRPTTRAPVLACHPDDVRWFEDQRILPKLARTTGASGATEGTIEARADDRIAAGTRAARLAGHRLGALGESRARQPTACCSGRVVVRDDRRAVRGRGAVGVPAERPRAWNVALDRVEPRARGCAEVAAHLREMLREQDLAEAELLVVPETELVDGLLPARRAGAGAPVARRTRCRRGCALGSDQTNAQRRAAQAFPPAQAGLRPLPPSSWLRRPSSAPRSTLLTPAPQREVEEAMRSGLAPPR